VIVLDTNVVSEPLRAEPDPVVMSWLSRQEQAKITAITMSELLIGVLLLPGGTRRDLLHAALNGFDFDVLPFDARAAEAYAHMHIRRPASGAPLSVQDGMIAAICLVHGATLATRNTKDFADLGVDLVDPWQA
jgi:predicted nucleic acid-binding protein